MLTLMFVAVGSSSSLASEHLGVAIDRALGDGDVMASPTQAWILTILYCRLGLRSWPERLAKLYEAFPKHVFLREVVADYALAVYRTTRNQHAAEGLEHFLADVFTPPGRAGADRVVKRAADRSQLLEELRAARMRYQRLGPGQALPLETLEEADEDDAAA